MEDKEEDERLAFLKKQIDDMEAKKKNNSNKASKAYLENHKKKNSLEDVLKGNDCSLISAFLTRYKRKKGVYSKEYQLLKERLGYLQNIRFKKRTDEYLSVLKKGDSLEVNKNFLKIKYSLKISKLGKNTVLIDFWQNLFDIYNKEIPIMKRKWLDNRDIL